MQAVVADLQHVEHLADQRGLQAWAAIGALSVRTLSRPFAAESGFAFADWRQRARLMRAVQLLAEGPR